MPLEPQHIALVQDDVEVVEIFGQPPHLHVIALADDDRVIAVADERRDRSMGHLHERAGRFDDLQAARAGAGQPPL